MRFIFLMVVDEYLRNFSGENEGEERKSIVLFVSFILCDQALRLKSVGATSAEDRFSTLEWVINSGEKVDGYRRGWKLVC